MKDRGIVITIPFEYDGRTLKVGPQMAPTPEALRFYSLYWDKIDWPDNNAISIGSDSAETAFLKDVGILKRSRVNIVGQMINVGDAMLIAQAETFRYYNDLEPGLWALAQNSHNLYLPEEIAQEKSRIDLELYRALPVPDEQVPLDDILTFKEKRKDELIAFRGLMDELYLEIISSQDMPRAKTKTIAHLQTSIGDLHRVMSESSISRRLSTVKIELNLSSFIRDALLAGAAAKTFGFSPEISAIIGVATSAIKCSVNIGPVSKEIPENLRDYAYLHYIEDEIFV